MTLVRRLAVGAIAAASFVRAPVAEAAESKLVADDVRVTVDDAGMARVDHALAYRVSGMSLREVELNGVEAEASPEPSAPVTIDGEPASAPATVERKGERALHVTFEPGPRPRGEKAHVVVVHVAYALDLVRVGELTLDGAMWRLAWVSPAAPEGYDGAKVVLDLPAAATEPRAIGVDGAAAADGRVVTLRRGPQRDELEMERPHVARAEAATWLARVDPRAFPRVTDPRLRPPPEVLPPAPTTWRDRLAEWAVALVVGVLFGAVVRAKARLVEASCARVGVSARALVPWSPGSRTLGAAAALAVAVLLQTSDEPVWSAFAVVLALTLAAHRSPGARAVPRGPGQWLALAPGEAFAVAPASSLLDATTTIGRATLALVAASSLGVGLLLSPVDPSWTWLAPLDASALLAVLLTGCASQLPPDRARAPVALLSRLHARLRKDRGLHVAPWARIPAGCKAPDELRLLVQPRVAMPGALGIEVGVAWASTPSGPVADPEVLVRVRDDSEAAARIAALAPGRPVTPGRKLDERVLRLAPIDASAGAAVALVRRLAAELSDRRKAAPAPAWSGEERRLPPAARLAPVA
jgi:hypothetical protein